MRNTVTTFIGKVWRVKVALRQHSGRFGHWPELSQFLSSYGGNPGNEGSYLLFHRVLWKMKKGECGKDTSKEK